MKLELYSGIAIYFYQPYAAKVRYFLCYGEDRSGAMVAARKYSFDFAKKNGIDYKEMQIELRKQSVSEIQEMLDFVRSGGVIDAPIEDAGRRLDRENIPLQIGDKTYNL